MVVHGLSIALILAGITHFPQITNNMGGMSRKKCDKIGNLAKKRRFFWDVGSKMRDSKGESRGYPNKCKFSAKNCGPQRFREQAGPLRTLSRSNYGTYAPFGARKKGRKPDARGPRMSLNLLILLQRPASSQPAHKPCPDTAEQNSTRRWDYSAATNSHYFTVIQS